MLRPWIDQSFQTPMIVGGLEEIRIDEPANEIYVADNYLGGRVLVFDLNTFAFKRGWGAEEIALHYTYVAMDPPSGGHSLPERVLGPVIRRSPASVGRAIGAAAYRYFG